MLIFESVALIQPLTNCRCASNIWLNTWTLILIYELFVKLWALGNRPVKHTRKSYNIKYWVAARKYLWTETTWRQLTHQQRHRHSHSLEKSPISPNVTWDRLLTRKKNRMGVLAQASHLEIHTNLGGQKVQSEGKRDKKQVSLSSPLPDSHPRCKAVPRQPCLGKVPALCNLYFSSSRPRAVNTKSFPSFFFLF